MDTFTQVDYRVADRVATITLNRPEARNGYTITMAGLLHSVHEPPVLLDAAYSLAAEIIDNTAPVAVAITRQMLYRASPFESLAAVHRLESRLVKELVLRPDAVEGVMSFLERRPAAFSSKISDGLPEFLPWVRGTR